MMKDILNSFECLPRLSEFLDIRAEHRNKDFYFYVINYSTFITQPLTKGMFIPCDEEGNVLEEPETKDKYVFDYTDNFGNDKHKPSKSYTQFQQAKDRVLFEVDELGAFDYWCSMKDYNTIEDAINAGVKLKLKG